MYEGIRALVRKYNPQYQEQMLSSEIHQLIRKTVDEVNTWWKTFIPNTFWRRKDEPEKRFFWLSSFDGEYLHGDYMTHDWMKGSEELTRGCSGSPEDFLKNWERFDPTPKQNWRKVE